MIPIAAHCTLYTFTELFHPHSPQPVEVILSPPPDLVVSSLEAEAVYTTGDTLRAVLNVTNKGAGEPFERYWNDELVSFAYFKSNLCSHK